MEPLSAKPSETLGDGWKRGTGGVLVREDSSDIERQPRHPTLFCNLRETFKIPPPRLVYR